MFSQTKFARSNKAAIAVSLAGVVLLTGIYTQTGVSNAAEPCPTVENQSGNIVFDAENCDSDFTPDIKGADAESQEIALNIYMGALKFCIAHPTLADIKKAGYSRNDGSHWFKEGGTQPSTTEEFYDLMDPATAMVEEPYEDDSSRIAGYMVYKYEGFPYIGKIPRTHRHTKDNNPNDEMYHTYCKLTVEEAFKYKESNASNTPSIAELQAALQKAETGGIAAVSSQLGGKAPAGAKKPTAVDSTPVKKETTTAATQTAPTRGRIQPARGTATASTSTNSDALRKQVIARLDLMSEAELRALLSNFGTGTAALGAKSPAAASQSLDTDRPKGYSKFVENDGVLE